MYLLDTNVVSELRRVKPHGAVIAWLQGLSDSDLHISAVTIGEIQTGIEITRQNDVNKADEIEEWLNQVSETFNILPMDARCFRIWAKLIHGRGDNFIEDAMIAATAKAHNLIVVTRNVKDFALLSVEVLNPFEITDKKH